MKSFHKMLHKNKRWKPYSGAPEVKGVSIVVRYLLIRTDFSHCEQAQMWLSITNYFLQFTVWVKMVVIHKSSQSVIFVWSINAEEKRTKHFLRNSVSLLANQNDDDLPPDLAFPWKLKQIIRQTVTAFLLSVCFFNEDSSAKFNHKCGWFNSLVGKHSSS